MYRPFVESHQECPKCNSSHYHRRQWYHLLGRFHCDGRCHSNFYNPKTVEHRTSSHRDDSSYVNLNKPIAKEHKPHIKLKLILGAFILAGVITLIIKVGILAFLIGVAVASFLWIFITHPPKKGRGGKVRLF